MKNLKPTLRRVHLILGIIACLPLAILGVTGALLVFPAELQRWISGGDYYVEPAGALLGPERIAQAVEAAIGQGDRAYSLQYPRHPHDVMTVYTRDRRLAIVDPYRGEVRRTTEYASLFIVIVTVIHVNLLVTGVGEYVTGGASFLLMLLSISGVYLWWPTGKLRPQHWLVRLKHGWRRANYDLHRLTGILSFAFLFFIALTGAVMAFPTVMRPLAYWITWSEPYPHHGPAVVPPNPQRIGSDALLASVRNYLPDHEVTYVLLPLEPAEPMHVTLSPGGDAESAYWVSLALDPYTGKLMHEDGPRTASRGDMLLRWVAPIHYGRFGGLLTKLLYIPIALSPAVLGATGVLIFLGRRQKQARARLQQRAASRLDATAQAQSSAA